MELYLLKVKEERARKHVSVSDLDLESAFRIRHRKFDLDFIYNFSITYPEC
jgi:hypothetical protein